MLLRKLAIVTGLALLLAGCGTLHPGSVTKGECRVFTAPVTVVDGKTPQDQYWIDDTVESGVGGCGWERPKPKPKKAVVKKKEPKKVVKKTPKKVVEAPKEPPPQEPTVTQPEEVIPWYRRFWNWLKWFFTW